MYFNSLTDFLAMGGYALYVWSAFIITAVAMGALLLSSYLTGKRLRQEIRSRIERDKRRASAKHMEDTL